MKDEKILQDEKLSEDELDFVVGGTRAETQELLTAFIKKFIKPI